MSKNRINDQGCFSDVVRRICNQNFSDMSVSTAQTDVTSSTAQTDVTSSTTLVNAAGLTTDSISVAGGLTYRFTAILSLSSGASGGVKIALKQSVASMLSTMESVATGFTASAVAVQHSTSTTDAASLYAQTAAVIYVRIEGTFTTALAGSLQVQFAQNVSDGTATSVLIGSQFIVTLVA